MNILIAGDLVPINSNEDSFVKSNCKNYFSDFEDDFINSDLFIANLECPLTSSGNRIDKSGSHLKAKPETIKGISELGINLASLANNHVGDYGDAGVKETISILESHNINILGAGLNSNEAKQPFIYKKDDCVVGVLSYADHEFGIAQENKPGANPFHLIDAFNDIQDLKKHVDYIIVLLHDGKEYYPYPSPELQKICRHLINLGANLVVCQHSHLIGAVEAFKTGNIVYGQGNFIFDYRGNYSAEWSDGFFIRITLDKNRKEVNLIPFKQSYPGIVDLDKVEKQVFFKTIEERAKQISDADFIKASWNAFVLKQKPSYISTVFGYNIFFGKVFKKTGLYKILISKKTLLIVLNFLRSRVHRESFVSILENLIKNNK